MAFWPCGGVGDRPYIGTRIFEAVRVPCDCCTFYRGVALGLVLGAIVATSVRYL